MESKFVDLQTTMESKDSTDGMSVTEDLSPVNLEETFITLQTKEGHSSEKIPLFQFLEQVVGARKDGDVKLETVSFLLRGNKSLGEEKTTIEEAKSETVSVPDSNVPQKPKGRGRPRKVKVGTKGDGVEISSSSTSAKHNNNKDKEDPVSVVKETTDPVQSLRRSSRIPAKNTRFKDDYVDSSIIASKSVSSGDTRLMTLALAAECHTTKPSKPNTTLNKVQSDTDKNTSTQDKSIEQKDISSKSRDENDIQKDNVKSNDSPKVTMECENQAGEVGDVLKHILSDSIPKRPLSAQLNLCISGTQSHLSVEPVCSENDKESEFPSHKYYIVIEPKVQPSGDALLVRKCDGGVKFNTAEISGNEIRGEPHFAPDAFPQDRCFTCDLCDKVFRSSTQWQHHYKHEHLRSTNIEEKSQTLKKEVYSCNRCNQKFPFQFMLDNHMEKQSEGSFSCDVCDQNFCTQQDQEEHQILSHPTKSCTSCGKVFHDIVLLRRHTSKCQGHSAIITYLSDSISKDIDSKEVLPENVKTENVLTSHEEVFKQREDNGIHEAVEEEKVETAMVKVECELCSLKFSTYSGLWHHKLEIHQEFFPPGYKDKLEARLEKNEQMLSSVSASSSVKTEEDKGKNNYFVVMKPKWYNSKMQLKVSMENKKFNFSPLDSETGESANGESIPDSQKDMMFHCNQCSMNYESASSYREHRSKVHNECFETVRYLGAFQCSYCSDTFPCEFMLNSHITQHTGKKLLPCTLCGLTFHKIQDRRQHWKQAHPGVGCPNCGKMYASIKYLQKHISLNCQDHYPATEKFIAFRKKQHNDFHMEEKDKRVEKKIIKCHLCPKICSSIHGWRRHMSENHEDEGFSKLSNTCIICNEVIYGYKALEKHLLEVHAEESGLPIEEENTIVKEAVKKSKVDLQDYQKAGKSNANIYQDDEGMYHCPECPKTHSDLKALTIHIKTHVNMQLQCGLCPKSFKNPTLLKQHVMRHRTTAVYDCDTCGKKFMTLQKLNKHNKVHHSKENFVCELCGMSFALNDYLLKHKRCHTDKRPHLCSVCGKTFRTKPELRVHVLIHTQETPYVCEHCGRGFTQKGNWRIHLAQHTGLKPHKCKLCDLSFALPSHLKRHLLTHNQKINYRCIWCDKECTQRKHMQMHVSRVHKEDFFQYEEQMKLETPIPIAPSQLKIYNRRLGKAGQVRKAYKTRAKKCNSSIQDIMDGVPRLEPMDEEMPEEGDEIKPLIGQNEETVTSDISINNQDISSAENMQILVSDDHQSYVKHDIPAELIGEDGSNVEIVMGENNEINIIINNTETAINTDLDLQDGLDENGPVSLTQFTDTSGQLQSSLQQAVNALVAGQKGEDGDDTGLHLDMDAMISGDAGDGYAIVYPSGS